MLNTLIREHLSKSSPNGSMAETLIIKPLGLVLQKAGLVSLEQVKKALQAQKSVPNRKIGEILTIRGWIKPETANFFAEQWPKLLVNRELEPLGQYLKAAGFIDDRQIEEILRQQGRTKLKFGAYAVLRGFISQTTLNFFLQHLNLIRERKIASNIVEDYQQFNQIESYILHNQQCDPSNLLKLYQKIRQEGGLPSQSDRQEIELINSGLVIKQNDKLKVANPQYESVFDGDWIEEELVFLQPYTQIRLRMFGLEEFASSPYKVLNIVTNWTGNQPFLTQKIYQIIREREIFIAKGEEASIIASVVEKYIIRNRDRGIVASHFQELEAQLLNNEVVKNESLLKVYRDLWQERKIEYNGSDEQNKLLDIGLAKRENNVIIFSNPIYHAIFDWIWIEKQLKNIGLNSQSIANSLKSQSDIMRSQEIEPHRNKISRTSSFSRKYTIPILTILGGVFFGIALNNFGREFLQINSQSKLLSQADTQLQEKKYLEAIETYNLALQEKQDTASIWVNRGYAFKGLKDYQSMLESCLSATIIQPELEAAWNCKGEALFHLKEYKGSVEALDKAIAINNQNPITLINYGEALHKIEQYQASEIAMERAINLLKNDSLADSSTLPLAYNGQGKSLLKQKKHSQALKAFTSSLAYAPNYLAAQQGKALALKELGKNNEAQTIFEKVLVRDDLSSEQKAVTWLYKGINFCSMAQATEANQAFDKVVELTNDYEQAVISARKNCL